MPGCGGRDRHPIRCNARKGAGGRLRGYGMGRDPREFTNRSDACVADPKAFILYRMTRRRREEMTPGRFRLRITGWEMPAGIAPGPRTMERIRQRMHAWHCQVVLA